MTKQRLLEGVLEQMKRSTSRDEAIGNLVAAIDRLADYTQYKDVAQQIVAAFCEVSDE